MRPVLLWVVVVFGVLNMWAGHERTPGSWWDQVAHYGTDDADVSRYFAYCNAQLGRPYNRYYVRTAEAWRDFFTGLEPGDPDLSPTVTPEHPLVPYREFLVEYPPGFFLWALPPALLTQDLDVYRTLFSVLMGLCLSGSLILMLDLARRLAPELPPGRLVGWMTVLVLALGVVAVRRYDAAVALMLCLSVHGLLLGRPVQSGLGLGLAIATKLVPFLLWPLYAGYLLRRGRADQLVRLTLATLATLALTLGPVTAAVGPAWLDGLSFHALRPLQIESTPALVLALGESVRPGTLRSGWSYGSTNVVGGQADLALALTPYLTLAGLLAVYVKSRRCSLIDGVLAVLAVFMVLGKVFSPQYLVWILPLGCLASLMHGGRRPWLLLAAMALTQLVYPPLYGPLGRFEPWATALVLARNLLLLAWAGLALLSAESEAASPPSRP